MKLSLLPLLALALAAGACSNTTPALSQRSITASPAGTLQTAWGELPTYQAEDGRFPFALKQKRPSWIPAEVRPGDSAVLDVLVARDGSVSDVKVHRSSGVDAVDRFFVNRFVGAQSLLQVPVALPYVVRLTHGLSVVSSSTTGTGQIYDDRNSNSKFSDLSPMGQGAKHWTDK